MSVATPLDPLSFPLHGSRLIEASAGTGKTWTLAALYVRLILGHGTQDTGYARKLLPTEILVVTFTEAATQELRERIRLRLSEAARNFRGLGKPDDFLKALIATYPPQEHPACARSLEVAAEWMDEAAIHTIHGWCNRMLRQHAFDSGALFDMAVEATDDGLLAEAVRDYWRTFLYPLDAALSRAVLQYAASPAALLTQILPLLRAPQAEWQNQGVILLKEGSPAFLQRYADWLRTSEALESAARTTWHKARAKIEKQLCQVLAEGGFNGNAYPKDQFASRLAAMADWAEYGIRPDAKWLERFSASGFKLNKSHRDRPPSHAAFTQLDALVANLHAAPDLQNQWRVHAAEWVRQRFAVEKQRRARMDFDDLLAHLDTALQAPGWERLAAAIRERFPVALIDEFQDTDPVQYRIFQTVYHADSSTKPLGLFLIGDPKQAIYSFRGADLHTYLEARVATQTRHYTLDRNFRSTADLVQAVNRWFSHGESHAEGAFKFKPAQGANPMPFLAVKAQGRKDKLLISGQAHPALTLWHRALDAAESLAEYREAMALSAASYIAHLLNLATQGQAGFGTSQVQRPLKPADIAILVRDRNESAAIRRALAERGVYSVYLSDRDSVFASGEALDTLYWLRAIAAPGQDAPLRAALATASLDLDFGYLDALNSDELRWEQEVERFKGYQDLWRRQGVLAMLRRLVNDFGLPSRWLRKPGGERRLTNLLHLAEWLQTASACLDGEPALIRHLAKTIAEGSEGQDGTILRLESDADLIKVVTIHKSKGLEYPLVFLPFACSFKEVTGRGQHYFRFHDAQGRACIDLGRGDAAKTQADRERLQEDLRLLYVALTRARHACWLGVAPVKSGNTQDCLLHKSAVGHLLAGGEPITAASLRKYLDLARGTCAAIHITAAPEITQDSYRPPTPNQRLADARAYTAPRTEPWWIASYSALRVADGPSAPMVPAIPQDAPDRPDDANLIETLGESLATPASNAAGLHDFPHGPGPGVFLHSLMEWAAREGFGRLAADTALSRDWIAQRCQRRGWERWIDPLNDWLGRLLVTPLFTGGPGLAALDRSAYQPEMEFWFESRRVDTRLLDQRVSHATLGGADRPKLLAEPLNGMFKGFIDLTFEHGGRYYVLDYKSNRLGTDSTAYTADALRNALLAKRYDLQYTLYLLALHRQLKARLGTGYDYDQHIGGAVYWFLRGVESPGRGLFLEKPPQDLIDSLDRMFAGMTSGEACHAA